jgi:hypothetical protein
LDFQNSKNRRIQTIELGNGYKANPSITVGLTENLAYDPRAHYRIVGDDKGVLYASSKLEDILANSFRWYSCITAGPDIVRVAIGGILFLSTLCPLRRS